MSRRSRNPGAPSAMPRGATKEKPRSIRTVAAESKANNTGETAPVTLGPGPMLQRRASGSIRFVEEVKRLFTRYKGVGQVDTYG
ncbi:hypothetical protein MTO96_009151 [Rhipicephalus appendiculatus]